MTHIIKIERVCTPNTYCIHYICIYTYIMTHYIHTPKLDSDTSKVKQSPDNRRVRDSSPPTPPFNHCPSDIVQWVAFVCVHTHTNTHTHTLTNMCVYLSKEIHITWSHMSHMCNHTWITCNGTPWVSCAITYHVQRHSMSLMWCVHTCSHICCVQLHLQFEHASSSSYLLRATTLAIWTRTQDTRHMQLCTPTLVYMGVHRRMQLCTPTHRHMQLCTPT
jgi:hypothetical protein